MSEPEREPDAPDAAYPPDDPWRLVLRRLLVGENSADLVFGVVLPLLLWLMLSMSAAADPRPWPAWVSPLVAIVLGGGLLALARRDRLRKSFMTQAGVALPERLKFNPLLGPLAVLAVGGAAVLAAAAVFAGTPDRPLRALLVAAGLLAAGLPAALRLGSVRAVTLGERAVSVRGLAGERKVEYAAVTRLDWKPSPGEGADRLRVEAPGGSASFFGQYERNNDLVFKVLERIIAPRLTDALAEIERRGRYALGPLVIHRDRYERPGDRPPVNLPFALAKTASINTRGEFVVEIPGRQEPLALLSPGEYPFVPLALRLTGALWKASADASEPAGDVFPESEPPAPPDEREN